MRCWHSVHSRVDVLLASGHAATNQTWQAPCAQDDFSHRQPRVGGVQCTHAPGASRSGANSAGDATSRCLATTRPVSKGTLRLRPHLAHLDEGLFEVCGCLGFMEVMSVWGHALASELFLSFALSLYKPENPTCPQPSQGYWRPPSQRRASVSVSVLPCMSPCATVHDPSDPPSPARHSGSGVAKDHGGYAAEMRKCMRSEGQLSVLWENRDAGELWKETATRTAW